MYTISGDSLVVWSPAGKTSIPCEPWIVTLVLSLDRRRRKRRFSLTKSHRAVSYTINGVRGGATEFASFSSRRTASRFDTLFGVEQNATIETRGTDQLLKAVTSLLEQAEREFDALAVEYGVSVPLGDPSLRTPGVYEHPDVYFGYGPLAISWSYFFSGLRFAGDPHPYTLWANFGVLDLIKHDPLSGDEIERSDIRSCTTLHPVNTAEIRIFRNTRDLWPLRNSLVTTRELLLKTSAETVSIMVARGQLSGYEMIVPDEFRGTN